MSRSNDSTRPLAWTMPALLLTGCLAAGAARAGTGDWEYGIAIYGWLPSLSGDLKYSAPDSGDGIDVEASKIVDALQMTFMGSFEARNGDWSGFTDVIYLKLAGDKARSVSVPTGTTRTLLDADLDMKGWLWTLGGAYTAWHNQASHLDLLVGARLFSLDTDLKLTGGGPGQRDGKLGQSVDLWDALLGVKGRVALNQHWFLPYYLDVGTGDTDLTWQLSAGVGYAFDWGDVTLAYRYLDYDQGGDALVQGLAFGGAKLGVAFRF